MLRWVVALLLLIAPGAAQAIWREATTRHFIIYSEASERDLREAALNLEKYDYLLRLMLNAPEDHPVRLKVYLMKDVEDVQKTTGLSGGGIAGYYSASPRGSIAVGMREAFGSVSMDVTGQMVLFHEYAHHLMLQYYGAAYPLWYVEGFAEYYGPTRILPDGFEVGQMAPYRRAWFHDEGAWLPLKKLLTARNYKDIDYKVPLMYAQGWLLVHYLADNKERSGQLGKYLQLINAGASYQDAMDAAFGQDAAQLDQELRRYSKRQRLPALRVTFDSLDLGEINVRTLSAARSALMWQEIALGRGVFAREARSFADTVRRRAADYHHDAHALALLTQAERLAGNTAAAKTAADRWLSVTPADPRARMFSAAIAIDALVAAKSNDKAAFDAERKRIADARAGAPNDPLILEAFYDSYAADGSLPPARAQNALYRAMEIVPQDDRLRYKVAADFERRGLIEAAVHAIRPAAFRAHDPEDETERQKAKRLKKEERWLLVGETQTERPRDMLARLESKLATSGATADRTVD